MRKSNEEKNKKKVMNSKEYNPISLLYERHSND